MNSNMKKALQLYKQGVVSPMEWAELVKVSKQAAYKWLENEEFANELKKIDDEILSENKKILSRKAKKAIYALEDVIDHSKNDLARVSAAKEILDRTGYEAEQKLTLDGAAPVQILDDIPRGEDNAKA